ncbi:hypothetical protein [Acinetobacter sp. WZC-1]|uniref:hypothetical protein n=1 Tax=Acinetobacter sp. WZC-1 TaxID=3459034 RepID=UPI00403E218A
MLLKKRVLKLCLLSIVISGGFACGYEKNNFENKLASDLEKKSKLSASDRKSIEEYNQISEHLKNGDEIKFHQELRLFLPKALKIQNNQERNNILMNIYMQTEQYGEAYKLNELQIEQNPTANKIAFRCQCRLPLN